MIISHASHPTVTNRGRGGRGEVEGKDRKKGGRGRGGGEKHKVASHPAGHTDRRTGRHTHSSEQPGKQAAQVNE